MLLIARVLMARPKLMLVDEISEGQQPSIIERLARALVAERERTGVAMLLVEQNVRFALAVADRWAVLKLGEATGPAWWRGQRTMTRDRFDRTSPALQRIPGAFTQEDSQ